MLENYRYTVFYRDYFITVSDQVAELRESWPLVVFMESNLLPTLSKLNMMNDTLDPSKDKITNLILSFKPESITDLTLFHMLVKRERDAA
jgi:hypothetical protein